METPYTGRFAPSPTGPLHAGSLLTALASWHDARAHGGRWLLRIEDIDGPRCVPGATELIMGQLQALGLHADGEVMVQSQRDEAYAQALDKLVQRGWAYPCACSRRDIEQALLQAGMPPERHAAAVYPGTCRGGLKGREGRAWRLDVARVLRELGLASMWRWKDRRLGEQKQDVVAEVGDFVLRRTDGLWAYQLAVVVDDAAQGVSDVVRGMDLLDNTARQIVLQKALGLPTPRHLHVPLVLGANGEKLSKQNGATALDLTDPGRCLREAAQVLAQAGWPIDPTQPLKVSPAARCPEP
jgi:glutamyl-Q tRNA(Asp) synthetase